MLKFLRSRFFGKKKILLSFEYGVVLSQVAAEQGIELTPEMIERAEDMIIGEFGSQSPTRLSVEMIPNIMSVFELDLSK